MKNCKFVVKVFNNDGELQYETEYNSYMDIANDFNIEYHHVRHLNLIHRGEYTRKIRGILLKLSKRMQIEDLDNLNF